MLMTRKIRTTVVVTAAAERILQRYRHNFGLKGPLSVGLMLFDALPPQEQIDRTRAVEEADKDPAELLGLLHDLVQELPETVLQQLTPSEAEIVRRYRAVVASERAGFDDEARAADAQPPTKRRRKTGR